VNKAIAKKTETPSYWAAFEVFVEEFKGETDRAAVILGAAKLDALLAQILDRTLLPSLSSTDELLEGDAPLATFSARINACYRFGLITADFAKSLHIVRKIRNSFAHEISGVSLERGAHSDRLKSLLLPIRPLPFFKFFRQHYFGESTPGNDFRACLAMMAGRLEARLEDSAPCKEDHAWSFIMESWSNEQADEKDDPSASPT
jgi:hypothetical protein